MKLMRLRFSIRDLLWLTIVVAMGLGWWLDHRQLQNQCEDLKLDVQRLGTFATPQGPINSFSTPQFRRHPQNSIPRGNQGWFCITSVDDHCCCPR